MTASFSFINEREAPSIAEQPAVQVKCWRAFEATNGDRHLLIILDHGSMRITSTVTSVEQATGSLTTQSGRRYQLLDSPEERQPQRTMLAAYALRSGLVDAADVSEALWQLLASIERAGR